MGIHLLAKATSQEARVPKIPELPSNLRWHFVGRLQKNKIRHALPLFELFHGVDSLALAQEINRIAAEEGMHPRILLEINVAEEGVNLVSRLKACVPKWNPSLRYRDCGVEGLMCVPAHRRSRSVTEIFCAVARTARFARKKFD